jgi:hypothetical protein
VRTRTCTVTLPPCPAPIHPAIADGIACTQAVAHQTSTWCLVPCCLFLLPCWSYMHQPADLLSSTSVLTPTLSLQLSRGNYQPGETTHTAAIVSQDRVPRKYQQHTQNGAYSSVQSNRQQPLRLQLPTTGCALQATHAFMKRHYDALQQPAYTYPSSEQWDAHSDVLPLKPCRRLACSNHQVHRRDMPRGLHQHAWHVKLFSCVPYRRGCKL